MMKSKDDLLKQATKTIKSCHWRKDLVCPVCGNDFYIEDLEQTMYYSICPDCGQALEWNTRADNGK